MKVLLLGEFSALHMNLKEGLLELGHDVVVAAHGDGFKKITSDISFDSTLPFVFGKIEKKIKPVIFLPKFKNFDVVQLVNPFFLKSDFFPTLSFYKSIIKRNEKFFVLGAGDDAYFWRFGRYSLKYGPFDDFLKFDAHANSFYMESEESFQFNEKLIEHSNGLIPIMFEYEKSYETSKKRLNTIPIPINVQKVEYKENIVGKKLVVFHGLNRYGFKGTRHVEEAFRYLQEKYPNDLELIIDGKMPLNEYLDLMKRSNIVIDQMYAHSLGVNGVYAMSMGKVVMGGAEPESLKSLGVTSSPVINLEPNSKSIIREVELLLKNRSEVQILGLESRLFCEKVHGHIKVAQQYIDTWSEN